jgi:hypothetical protein
MVRKSDWTFEDEFRRQGGVIGSQFGGKKPEMRTITVTKPTGLRIKYDPEKYEVTTVEGEVVIALKTKAKQ